jgi:hypothetical protein
MMLDTFRCNAIDLCRPEMQDVGFWLRLDGDSEDPNTWHEVDTITEHFGGGVDMLTVTFKDGTDEKVLNETDQVEFAVIRPDS